VNTSYLLSVNNNRPYNDGWIITSQVLSIIATLLSIIIIFILSGVDFYLGGWLTGRFVWSWIACIISMAGMALFQTYWCCRQNSATTYTSVLVAGVSSLSLLGYGIYYLVRDLRTRTSYYVDFLVILAIILIVSGALWAAAAACMFDFIKSGRHAKWEEKHSNQAGGNSTPAPVPEPSSAAGGPTIATAIPVPDV